jgi:hypothetical protein
MLVELSMQLVRKVVYLIDGQAPVGTEVPELRTNADNLPTGWPQYPV